MKRKIVTLVVIALCLLPLIGCANTGPLSTRQEIDQITPHKTTKADLIAKFGQPGATYQMSSGTKCIWSQATKKIYWVSQSESQAGWTPPTIILEVYFDREDKVIDYLYGQNHP